MTKALIFLVLGVALFLMFLAMSKSLEKGGQKNAAKVIRIGAYALGGLCTVICLLQLISVILGEAQNLLGI